MFVVSPVAATRMLHHNYDLLFDSCSLSFSRDMCLGSVVTISLFIITVVNYFFVSYNYSVGTTSLVDLC